jgi:hypothetical protein
MTVVPLRDVLAETRRILDAAEGIPLRVPGGAALALSADGNLVLPRDYNDIDFITGAGGGPEVVRTFEELGYAGDQRFNGLNGHRRLLFYDTAHGRRIDVFVAKFEMCHTLPLAKRLTLAAATIPLADLLLTKLQIFALNEKDQRDVVNLLHAHPLSPSDAAGIYASDIHGSELLWRKFLGVGPSTAPERRSWAATCSGRRSCRSSDVGTERTSSPSSVSSASSGRTSSQR